MLVGVSDALVILFLVLVFVRVRVRVASVPECSDKILRVLFQSEAKKRSLFGFHIM